MRWSQENVSYKYIRHTLIQYYYMVLKHGQSKTKIKVKQNNGYDIKKHPGENKRELGMNNSLKNFLVYRC